VPGAKRAAEITAQAQLGLEGPPLRRTASGLVVATPENLAQLLALPSPPPRLWWEKAEMEFRLVPAGEFLMGSADDDPEARDDEKPQHRVYLDTYYLAHYPVTQAQYARFVQATRHRVPAGIFGGKAYNWDRKRKAPLQGREDHPVVQVDWDDAAAFCQWAGLRLSTEAEWEKAARGTDGRIYPWGKEWDASRCNSSEGGKGGTTPVGAYSPAGDSPYGCADMAGNVCEWVADWYDAGYYGRSPARNPQGPDSGQYRGLRGGSSNNNSNGVRSANRVKTYPVYLNDFSGFRCCLSPMSFSL
jgi:formylglycine-generating enzyme required for sulfatase activity